MLRRERIREEHIEISVLFADHETVRQLNRDYREIDAATDVLSFPQLTRAELERAARGDDEVLLGDVVVCVDVAREQARVMGHSLKQESALLLAHGLCHLVGLDHATPVETEEMRRAESDVLAGAAYLSRLAE